MFRKKRSSPWFLRVLMNLVAVLMIYRLARGFQKHTLERGYSKK
jgi:hypothetical protein